MEVDYSNIKVIGFDADDTLWVNETYFREAEEEVGQLLSHYETPNKIDQELFRMEIENLPTYGYGVKGFILSMIELAVELSNGTVSNAIISRILVIGKDMINKPIELLDGVEEVLKILSKDYKLIVATKGDLLDQERKLEKSGLLKYFHHIEVLSEKHDTNYIQLLKRLDIEPESFLMIGNSLKSDILPLVKIGSKAIHVPFHTTWQHEKVSKQESNGVEYKTEHSLTEILKYFN
ncbi:Hydrolase, haloacid delahogenase-like family [Winogradskyella psychrotolerans RS-3]|uniref:Hydrolase, haloacid delahogenase-like family n=1 Tax=Winogradskyella psychrotolerans RS-3 TaxID=641526 RepID=S7X3S9_9FLAO|nr:HAD family hydrolase [Winogradskyella psychrotolerans]EPR73679.1 Hydrolase, haloacid delahogenase-like family [Winogradskyella psychrotolerans RS-3]